MRPLRTILRSATVLTLSAASLAVLPSPASAADTTPRVMATTQRMTGPHLTNYYQHGTYNRGTDVTLYCYERGQAVRGYYSPYVSGGTSNIWYQTTDGHWIADIDINTGANGPVVGGCETAPDTNQWYEFVAKHSGKAVDVRGGSTGNGTALQQYTRNSTASQQFRFSSTGSGYYRITPRTNSGQAWDIAGGPSATADGKRLQVWSYVSGATNQQWKLHKRAGGGYTLTPRNATNKCADVPGGSRDNGKQLHIWRCSTATQQIFLLNKKGAVSTTTSSTPYRLPFKKGTRYQITQGPAEHAGGLYPDYNRHAVDFATPSGTPVLASNSGKIYFEGYDSTDAIQIKLDHGGDNCSQYVHLSRTVVDKGQSVSRGQVIGYSGATGIGTGPHLHWNMVYCGSGKSRSVINTLEMGTTYRVGMSAYSQNG